MPAQDGSPVEQVHNRENNLGTPRVTTIELGQDSVSALEVAVGFHNSEISLTIVHRPPMDHPIMTTRTRTASFSESEYESEFHSLEGNVSSTDGSEHVSGGTPVEGTPVVAVASGPELNGGEEETDDKNREKEGVFKPESEESSDEVSEDYSEDHTTESLAVTLIRRALPNTTEVRKNTENVPSITPPRLPSTGAGPIELPAKHVQLSFFNPPEPSYVLQEIEDGVTVDLTNQIKLKFFSVESGEIEDALSGLPTIAPEIRSLIEKAKEQLTEAVDCIMWDLSGKKSDMLQEPQEIDDESKRRSIVAGLDTQVKFTVTATCFGEKMVEMTL